MKKKIKMQYLHKDTINNVSVSDSSNSNINIVTHTFNLENTKPNSIIYLSAIIYKNDNIFTNVNNLNTIKLNDYGCITYTIPLFIVDFNNLYTINTKETTPIISKIISGSGKFAGIKGYVKTIYDKDICYITIYRCSKFHL